MKQTILIKFFSFLQEFFFLLSVRLAEGVVVSLQCYGPGSSNITSVDE